jgi:hypothetical protein
MKTVRVSKNIMDALNERGRAYGTKYNYVVWDKLSPNCIVVKRYPCYYYHHGVGEGWRRNTLDYASRNGMVEILQVKGA